MSETRNVLLRDLLTDSQNGLSKRKGDEGEATAVLRLADISNGVIDETSPREISLTSKEIEKYALLTGDLVCIRVNGSKSLVGRVIPFRSNRTWAYCDHFIRFRPRQQLVDSRYLAHYFQTKTVRGHVELNMVSSAGQNTVSQGTMLDIAVPLPSLSEQHHAVAEIEQQFSRLDEAVANLRRVKVNLRRYKAAVLKAAVEGRLVGTEANIARTEGRDYESGEQLLQRILAARRADWHKKTGYREPSAHLASDGDGLPEGWTWATVEQLNPGNRPCAYGVVQPGDDLPGGIPFVRVGDIDDGRIEVAQMKRIHDDIAAAYPRTKLRGGEVLLTLVGAIGRTAVVPPALAGGNVARAVGVLPISASVDAHWVEIWFRNPAKIVEMTGKSHEVARKTLNLEDVRLSAVALPPLAEQHRIVAEVDRRLSIVRELEAEVDANLKRAEALRQAVLAKAFMP